MQKAKPKVAVILAGSEGMAFAIANVIIGLRRYNEDLITNIFIYHDMQELTRDKISSLWQDRIIWISYAYEDFLRDMECVGEIFIPQDSRWLHFIYAKFHIFDHLRDYDYAIWIDGDVLVMDALEDTLAKNVDVLGVNVGDSYEVAQALELLGQRPVTISKQAPSLTSQPIDAQNPFKPNGSFLSFNASVLKKIGTKDATKECFGYLKLVTDLLLTESGRDEAPFGILISLYKLDFECIDIAQKIAIAPKMLQDSQKVIHAYGGSKFWDTPLMFIAFQEWFVNHKIWERIHGKKPLNFKHDNLHLTNPAALYHFLWNLNALYPLYFEMCTWLLYRRGGGHYLKLLPFLNGKFPYLDIYSNFLGSDVFYRFAAGEGYGTDDCFMQLQIVCLNPKLYGVMESFAKTHGEFILIYNKNAAGEIADSYLAKDVSVLGLEERIQGFFTLVTESFNLFYQALYHRDFIFPTSNF